MEVPSDGVDPTPLWDHIRQIPLNALFLLLPLVSRVGQRRKRNLLAPIYLLVTNWKREMTV